MWCSVLILSQFSGTPPGQYSLLLCFGLSLSVHGIILTRLAVPLSGWDALTVSLSQFLGVQDHSSLSHFNSSLTAPPCDITKTREGLLFSCEDIHVFIGHRLQQVLGPFLCLTVVLFYMWQYTVQC